MNPAEVGGGLDMIVCEQGKIQLLSETETNELFRRSLEFDEQIAAHFGW